MREKKKRERATSSAPKILPILTAPGGNLSRGKKAGKSVGQKGADTREKKVRKRAKKRRLHPRKVKGRYGEQAFSEEGWQKEGRM